MALDFAPCACLSADRNRCYDLRYYGYAPAERDWGDDDDECLCVCHEKEADEETDEAIDDRQESK